MANIFNGIERTFAPPTVVAQQRNSILGFDGQPIDLLDDGGDEATAPGGKSMTDAPQPPRRPESFGETTAPLPPERPSDLGNVNVPQPPKRPEFPTNKTSSYTPAHFERPPIFSGQPTSGGFKQPVTGLAPEAAKIAQQWAGASRGESGECVALVKAATNVGHTSMWRPGDSVGANTPIGTPIATFGDDGRYKNVRGQSHAALYLGEGSKPGSIKVLDQWRGHAAAVREIDPGNKPEAAQNFRTIVSRNNMGSA